MTEEELGRRLASLRRYKGLTQAQLGEILDVSYAQISRYERGEQALKASEILKICEKLEVGHDYFFADEFLPAARVAARGRKDRGRIARHLSLVSSRRRQPA